MAITTGSRTLGPDNATLRVKTGRQGAAAKAGHDLVIEVRSWEATLDVDGAAGSLVLTADPTSLRVIEGVGGLQALGDDDKNKMHKTIDKDVLKGRAIEFRSSAVSDTGAGLAVTGELTIAGTSRPVEFVVSDDGGRIAGSATVKQSDWKIKPYSTMLGALKVSDDVTVEVEGR